jgi:hypothetical protein
VINPVEPHGGPSGYGPPPPRPTNVTAIAALVCAILVAPAGIVLGYVARSQIRRTGEAGGGMATAALIIGWVLTILGIAAGVIIAIFVALGYFVTETLPNWL